MLQIYVSEDKIMVSGGREEIKALLEKLEEELDLKVVYSGRCG